MPEHILATWEGICSDISDFINAEANVTYGMYGKWSYPKLRVEYEYQFDG